MFWWTWPSIVTEIGSGVAAVLLSLLLIFPFPSVRWAPWLTGLTATGTSLIYEHWFDANGWSWVDVGQRQIGIVLGVVLLVATRALLADERGRVR